MLLNKIKVVYLISFVLMFSGFGYSQTKLFGKVRESSKLALPSASVILKDSLSKSIIAYTYTNTRIVYYGIGNGVYVGW